MLFTTDEQQQQQQKKESNRTCECVHNYNIIIRLKKRTWKIEARYNAAEIKLEYLDK